MKLLLRSFFIVLFAMILEPRLGSGDGPPSQTPPPPPRPQAVNIPPLAIKGAKHMIDVGGRRLHCAVSGSGGPTVILVSGFQAPQEYWNPLVPGIAEITTVVTYDRAGYGKSERGDRPVHGSQTVEDLHVLLGKLGVPKPYLLVGHSYGGRIVRLFASAYPGETASLVLEEAGHEDLPDAQLEALTGKDRETLAAMIAPYRTTVRARCSPWRPERSPPRAALSLIADGPTVRPTGIVRRTRDDPPHRLDGAIETRPCCDCKLRHVNGLRLRVRPCTTPRPQP